MPHAAPPPERAQPLPRWRRRWQAWWIRRQPRSDTLTLTQRNVYILPTRAGWVLGITLLVMLVGSINYQLNLGYLLTFLLAGSTAVAMHLTHGNLRQLQLNLRPGPPVFAGQALAVHLTLHNPGRRPRYGLALRWQGGLATAAPEAWTDVEAQSQSALALALPTRQRGRQELPALELETRFPMGAFRAWSWWRPAASAVVYPAPEASPPPLPLEPSPMEAGSSALPRPGQGDEPEGVRPWRRGDPLKWVVWKKAAKDWSSGRDRWISRDFERPLATELWLDTQATGLRDPEATLSRLCAWVLMAETAGHRYGLILPGVRIAPDQGPEQQRRCLEALALC